MNKVYRYPAATRSAGNVWSHFHRNLQFWRVAAVMQGAYLLWLRTESVYITMQYITIFESNLGVLASLFQTDPYAYHAVRW